MKASPQARAEVGSWEPGTRKTEVSWGWGKERERHTVGGDSGIGLGGVEGRGGEV